MSENLKLYVAPVSADEANEVQAAIDVIQEMDGYSTPAMTHDANEGVLSVSVSPEDIEEVRGRLVGLFQNSQRRVFDNRYPGTRGGTILSQNAVETHPESRKQFHATHGVMQEGCSRVITSSGTEEVHVTRGVLHYSALEKEGWQVFGAGQVFTIPAGTQFELMVRDGDGQAEYTCYYLDKPVPMEEDEGAAITDDTMGGIFSKL